MCADSAAVVGSIGPAAASVLLNRTAAVTRPARLTGGCMTVAAAHTLCCYRLSLIAACWGLVALAW